jgi:hypothetical protein
MPPIDKSTPSIIGPDESPPPVPVGGAVTIGKT